MGEAGREVVSSSPDSNGLPVLEEFHVILSWWETKSSFLRRNRKFSHESFFLASFAVQAWPCETGLGN